MMPNDESYLGGEPPDRQRLLYFTPDEIAEQVRVTRRTVYRWITEGKLKAVKAGAGWRISERAIGEFLNGQGYCFTPEGWHSDLAEKGKREGGVCGEDGAP